MNQSKKVLPCRAGRKASERRDERTAQHQPYEFYFGIAEMEPSPPQDIDDDDEECAIAFFSDWQ